MKHKFISLCMVVSLLLAMLPHISITASATSADVAEVYVPAIERVLNSSITCVGEELVSYYAKGILYDLDNDGIDELVLSYPQATEQKWLWYYAYSIYDVEQGKLVTIAEDVTFGASATAAGSDGYTGVAVFNGEPVLITCSEGGETSTGAGCKYPKQRCTVNVYSYDDLSLIKTVEVRTTYDEIIYSVNGNDISEEKFQKEIEAFTYLEFVLQNDVWIYLRNTIDSKPLDELLSYLKSVSPEENADPAIYTKRLVKIIQTMPGYEDATEYTFIYNEWNLPASIHQSYSSGYEHTVEYIYDKEGRFIRYGSSDENVYTYDSNGRLTKYVDRVGDMVSTYTYFYDSEGKLDYSVCDRWYSSETTRYFYDQNGNLERAQNESGSEYYAYDSKGRLQNKQNEYATTTYSYNADGRLESTYTEQNHPTLVITSRMVYDYESNAPFIVAHGEDTDSALWIEDTEGRTVWSLNNTRSTAYTGDLEFETDPNGLVISAEDELWKWEFIYETLEVGIEDNIELELPNYNGFGLDKDGWTFANASQSFAEEPANHADDYFIPRERYDALYGKSYVDAQADLFTTDWGGNCAGMSATAILFFLDSLNWESIDAEYTEDFANPNDFYRTVNLDQRSQSYYPAIGNDNEVTRLIEAYQLYINAINRSRLVENLEGIYFAAEPEIGTLQGVTAENEPIVTTNYTYRHIPTSKGGTYIASMLKVFQEAYNENNPLLVALHGDDFGHAVVTRTDLKPEDMGDGWWRVYVYDPNKPYINDSVTSTVSGVEANPKYRYGCNALIDNGGDIYLELNPSLNQWRYCTSVNSNSSDSYIGSTESGELLWNGVYSKNENNEQYHVLRPDFFYTIDLTGFTMEDYANPQFDSTNAWIPENELAVAVTGDTNCTIYNSDGELVAIVENGEAFALINAGGFSAYIGQSEDGDFPGGTLYLSTDVYTVHYTSGIVHFRGNDNVLSFSSEGAAELTVDVSLNFLNIMAQEDGIVTVKCANVASTDECSYVDTEGVLLSGETLTIAYSDEDKVEASTDSKDGEFQLYQQNADQDEPVATKVVKSNSLWWLWIAGGIVVVFLTVIMWAKRKKS